MQSKDFQQVAVWSIITLWLTGGSFLQRYCCLQVPAIPLSITDGVRPVAGSTDNVWFGLSGAVPEFSAPVRGELDRTAAYLAANPDRMLVLNGKYKADESIEAGSAFENLGLARAGAVRDYLVAKGAPADRIRMTADEDPLLIFARKRTSGAISFDLLNAGLLIKDGSSFEATSPQGLIFTKSTPDFQEITFEQTKLVYLQTAEYLHAHPDRTLTITGSYHPNEPNATTFADLGLARADHVKDMLVELGAPREQILLASNADDKLNIIQDEVFGGADYTFAGKDEARLAAIEDGLRNGAFILFFPTGASTAGLSADEKQWLDDLAFYLKENGNKRVVVSGHTDNVGTHDMNMKLSEKRAVFVRSILTRAGVESRRVTVTFEGPDQPKGSNDTEEGRAANRRTEISLQ